MGAGEASLEEAGEEVKNEAGRDLVQVVESRIASKL